MPITQKGLEGLWLKALLFVLFGYALLDKGFAYLFLGELILVFGLMIFLLSGRIMLFFSDSVLFLWGLFALWGICRTVPYISVYHFNAVRDAALWAYGLFAVLIVAFVNRSLQISRALNAYRKFLRWYLPVIPALVLISLAIGKTLPYVPWSKSATILTLKTGDVAVSVAAGAVFLLNFPARWRSNGKHDISIYRTMGFAGVYAIAMIVMVTSRGGFLSIILAVVLVSAFRVQGVVWKIAGASVLAATLALAVVMTLPSNFHIGRKYMNAEVALSTVATFAGGSEEGTGHKGTLQWRLVWWGNIVRETIFGPFCWTGRGFGVNLAVADGPFGNAASEEDVALRSPHNGSMTILARMGVPGLLIWLTLNMVFVVRVFKAQRKAVRSGSRFWSSLNLWILACWLATFANLSFDVYLEGPQGGILFWSVIGFGVAALRIHAYESRLAIRSSARSFDEQGAKIGFAGAYQASW